MDSYYVVLDSNSYGATQSDDFTVHFSQPLDFGIDRWEVALAKLSLWYSWLNISVAQGNNTMSYFNGAVNRSVVFPDGQYSVSDINDYLHSAMKAYGDYTLSGTVELYDISLDPNYATDRITLTLSGGYTIDLTSGNLYYILGANQAVYATSGDFPNPANITNDIDDIWARCSIVQGAGSILNNATNDIIYTFVPDTLPNSNINVVPLQLIYMPINTTNNLIRNIRVRLTDNLSRRLDLQNQPTTFTLHFRKVK